MPDRELPFTRERQCHNGHRWTAPIVLSEMTINLSGEKMAYCPECGARPVVSFMPKRLDGSIPTAQEFEAAVLGKPIPKPPITIEKVQTVYSIEIGKRRFRKILDRELTEMFKKGS